MPNSLVHLIQTDQLHKDLINILAEKADELRELNESRDGRLQLKSMLSDKRAILFFEQPSTRTFFSFANACHILGMSVTDCRDNTASSQAKGESIEDTIHTFANYVDLCVIRHSQNEAINKALHVVEAFDLSTRLVNAGNGDRDHPTQALLDVYTLIRHYKGDLKGKTVTVVGDLARGRAAKAFIKILMQYEPEVSLQLVSTSAYRLDPKFRREFVPESTSCHETSDFESALQSADVLYMTRMQNEWGGDSQAAFQLMNRHLATMKKDASILHPLPRREEILPDVDHDERALYWEQEKNGLWIRCALLLKIFGVEIN